MPKSGASSWRTPVRFAPSGTRCRKRGRGRTLDEASARALAQRTVLERYHLDVSRGQAREVSAKPQKLSARTDWTFTFVDTTIAALPQGEPRIEVGLAGDEVAATGRFIYIPEEWQRQNRAAETRNFVLQILVTLVFGGLLVSAAVAGVIAWSRHEYTPRVFVLTAALMLVVSVAKLANSWPTVLAGIPTAVPLAIAVAGVVGIGIVGLLLSASLAGLSLGAQPRLLAECGYLDEKDATRVAIAVGLFGAAVAAAGGWLRMPAWARVPDLAALGTIVPILQLAIDPITGFLTRTAVILSTLVSLDRFTSGWTERRLPAIAAVVVIGFLAAGMPIGVHLRGWLLAGALTSLGFTLVSLTALRFDLTMVPLVAGHDDRGGRDRPGGAARVSGRAGRVMGGRDHRRRGRLVAVQAAADDPREPGRGRPRPSRGSDLDFLISRTKNRKSRSDPGRLTRS